MNHYHRQLLARMTSRDTDAYTEDEIREFTAEWDRIDGLPEYKRNKSERRFHTKAVKVAKGRVAFLERKLTELNLRSSILGELTSNDDHVGSIGASHPDQLLRQLPKWEGSHSYRELATDATYHSFSAQASGNYDGFSFVHSVASVLVHAAHPVTMDRDQLAVLPHSDLEQLLRYGQVLRLPFPVCYFDFANQAIRGVDMLPQTIETIERFYPEDNMDEIWADADEAMGGEGKRTYELLGMLAWHRQDLSTTMLPYLQITNSEAKIRRGVYGAVTWMHDLPDPKTKLDDEFDYGDAKFHAPTIRFRDIGIDAPGHVRPASHPDTRERTLDEYRLWVVSLATLVRPAIETVEFLDSANVEVVEQPLNKAGRRRVEREDDVKISSIVRVADHRKVYKQSVAHPTEPANYSHRFEVRGHYKHHVDNRIARARPDLVKPCTREDHDECRRVWCPPAIKGPKDKPFVPKTRVGPNGD